MGAACSSKKNPSSPSQSKPIPSPTPPSSHRNQLQESPDQLQSNNPSNPVNAQQQLLVNNPEPQSTINAQPISNNNPSNSADPNHEQPSLIAAANAPHQSSEEREKENEGIQVAEKEKEKENLEEMDFNEGAAEQEGVENNPEQNFSLRDYEENQYNEEPNQYDNYGNENNEYQEGSYDDENNYYEDDDDEYGYHQNKMNNDRRATVACVAIKADDVSDFFVAPPVVEEKENDGEINKEFKNVQNETTDHDQENGGEEYQEEIPQVIKEKKKGILFFN
jgi:hypothetical protein